MSSNATAHINASASDFAETVIMPGDPMRAKFIAENFLDNAKLVNNVRGIQGYTGYYEGSKISVMASGMGMPSIGIYSYELFNFFDVENIIRVGSAGSYREDIKIRDIVIAEGACTNSNYGAQFALPGSFAPIADFGLLRLCCDTADEAGLRYRVGNILSSDIFYGDSSVTSDELDPVKAWGKMGVMAVEMETAALYMNAARAGKRALTLCTISDNLVTGEQTTSQERESTFTDMITLALKTAIKI